MKKQKGTTLIEALVAITVIVIGLLALYSAIISGMTINLKAKHKAIAYNIGAQEMEIIRNEDFTSLSNRTDDPFIGTITDLDKLPQGTGQLTISDYGGTSDIKQVIIKVLWQEMGQQKNITLTTLVYKEGLNQ